MKKKRKGQVQRGGGLERKETPPKGREAAKKDLR